MQRQGIPIIDHKKFVYTRHAIEVLYDHMDEVARSHIAMRYCRRSGHALLMDFNSIDQCLEYIGRESDPDACEPNSIRSLYCAFAEPEMLGTVPWWENGIHRPIDERERLRDLKLVFPEYPKGAA
ncbi:hypothetical protein BH11PAT2_BH11PAT2_05360 [soil metagenome]